MAQLLCTVVPAGLEAFFEEIGESVAACEFLPPPIAPLFEEDSGSCTIAWTSIVSA